jgi:hypothetical protein
MSTKEYFTVKSAVGLLKKEMSFTGAKVVRKLQSMNIREVNLEARRGWLCPRLENNITKKTMVKVKQLEKRLMV